MRIVFSSYAKKQWKKFSPKIQDLIKRKIIEMKQKSIIFSMNLKKVSNLRLAMHRLRIGNYRMLLKYDSEIQGYKVLKIGHRREIYK